MISLAQLVDGSADSMTVEQLKRLYQIADSDGDKLAIELIVELLEKKKAPVDCSRVGAKRK